MNEAVLAGALEAAWRLRIRKNMEAGQRKRAPAKRERE